MKFRFTPIATAVGFTAGMLVSGGAFADTIKIAIAGPFTGPVTQYGDMVKQGVDTAIEQLNAGGGILGNTFEAVQIDDGCEPKQGPVVANRVVNDEIHYVVGHVCSGATIAATDIYNNEGVVMVTPSATSPAVTDGKNYEFIFRTIGRDDQQGPAAAKFIAEKIKPKKVAVLHDKQSYGQGIASAVRNDLQKAGIDVVLFEGINAGDSDYSAVITKLKSSGADFVYYGGYHPEMGLLLRQGSEQGLKVQFMGPEGVGNPDINAIAGAAVEGMLVTLPADFTKDAANADIVKAFKDKGRDPGGAFQMTAYSAMMAIAQGIKGAGKDDPSEVAKYLHSHSVKQGDLNDFKFDVFTWHKDGSKTVYQ
jgi:branched-chain amino acid transport system substrate-binding protein